MAKTQFETRLAEEVGKSKGLYYPVRVGFLQRVLTKSASCDKLHPNPNDEFCVPEIGPNYEIISHYEDDFRRYMANPGNMKSMDIPIRQKLDVQKSYPDGYLILNGHHRWAAARRTGVKKLPVHIVNLTQESDIQKMLASSTSTRRVTLDLDEVVFRPEDDPYLEKPLPFPLRKIYKQRLRLGIPALFRMMNSRGYDIWVYTANLLSLDYIRYYMKRYHIHVTGIVTGTGRKAPTGTNTGKELEKLLEDKYQTTVHIDNERVLRTTRGSKEFDDYTLDGNEESWSLNVMEIFEKKMKDE